MPRGLFITIEGIDGSGKSTQVALLKTYLENAGHRVLQTREPGGTPLAMAIRAIFKASWPGETFTPEAEMYLISAGRAQHVFNVIEPALKKGDTVLCDRYVHSTLAYQGGRGMSFEDLEDMNQKATFGIFPDVVILVDVPLEVSQDRADKRGTRDRLDADLEYQIRVRDAYLELAMNDDRFIVVDGSPAPEVVHRKIVRALAPRLHRLRTA